MALSHHFCGDLYLILDRRTLDHHFCRDLYLLFDRLTLSHHFCRDLYSILDFISAGIFISSSIVRYHLIIKSAGIWILPLTIHYLSSCCYPSFDRRIFLIPLSRRPLSPLQTSGSYPFPPFTGVVIPTPICWMLPLLSSVGMLIFAFDMGSWPPSPFVIHTLDDTHVKKRQPTCR